MLVSSEGLGMTKCSLFFVSLKQRKLVLGRLDEEQSLHNRYCCGFVSSCVKHIGGSPVTSARAGDSYT